eukprot:g16532.t1
MGDSGSNPGMRGLCAETARKYNVYVLCLDVADGVASVTTKMDDQLLAFVQVVQKDAKLKNGFNLMGNSQGGLLSRAYIERWNNPPVRRFVSLDGTQHGIATCPTSLSWACPLFTRVLNPYSTPLVFSDYWRDPSDKAKFLAESRFLADVGNDRAAKNATYAANMRSLDGYVMIEATRDSMVHPHESESHGFYAWGEPTKVETMTETQAYQEDWIGLRTLHEANKLVFLKYAGEHMQVPREMLHEMRYAPYGSVDFDETSTPSCSSSSPTSRPVPGTGSKTSSAADVRLVFRDGVASSAAANSSRIVSGVSREILDGDTLQLYEDLDGIRKEAFVEIPTLHLWLVEFGARTVHEIVAAYFSGNREVEAVELLPFSAQTTPAGNTLRHESRSAFASGLPSSHAHPQGSAVSARRYEVPEAFYTELERLDRFLLAHFQLLLEDVSMELLPPLLEADVVESRQHIVMSLSSREIGRLLPHLRGAFVLDAEHRVVDSDGEDRTLAAETQLHKVKDVTATGTPRTAMKHKQSAQSEFSAREFVDRKDSLLGIQRDAKKWVAIFNTSTQRVREAIYAGRKAPIARRRRRHTTADPGAEEHHQQRADEQADGLGRGDRVVDLSSARRQFVIERQAQIQAAHEFEDMQEQLSKYDTLADVGECKKIWLRWVSELTKKIDRIRFHETAALTAEEKKTVLRTKVPSFLPSDLLAVVTCRTAFSCLYQPKKDRQKDEMSSIAFRERDGGILALGSAEGVEGDAEDGDAADGDAAARAAASMLKKKKKVDGKTLYAAYRDEPGGSGAQNRESAVSGSKVKVVMASGDVLAVPFADICSKIGEAVNFEYNCFRVNSGASPATNTNAANPDLPRNLQEQAPDEDASVTEYGDAMAAAGHHQVQGGDNSENFDGGTANAMSDRDSKHLRKLRNAAAAEKASKDLFRKIENEDVQAAELRRVQESFAKETKLTQRKLYYEKIKMLEDPVWDKYTVRIPLGGELTHLLLECCPVECDYEEAKHLLSKEQQEAWQQKKRSSASSLAAADPDNELRGEASGEGGSRDSVYGEMHHSADNYDRVEVNALYHRLIWQSRQKMQGQIVMREICRKQLEEANFPATIRPVNPPMVAQPLPWLGPRKGCYFLHSRALDSLSSVPWRVNQKVFDVMDEIWRRDLNIAKVPPRENVDLKSLFKSDAELAGLSAEEVKLHLLQIQQAKRKNTQLVSDRPTFLLRLGAAREYYHAEQVFFPHSIDFRGRSYPIPPHWNHQGPDICRGLLEFAEGKKLGHRGWYWLKVACANLYGKDKLRLDDRVAWCEQNLPQIRAVARDPLGSAENVEFWSTAADGAFQFLAKCFEIDAALRHPGGPEEFPDSHTPVFQDGSCNGLQHYAALGRDARGGAAVNLLPSEVPQDVYVIVLNECITRVEADAENKNNDAARLILRHGCLKRSTVKQTVMTICYGVTILGATEQVRGKLRDLLGSRVDEATLRAMARYLAQKILHSVDEVFDRAMQIKKWFDQVSTVFARCNLPCSWFTPFGLAVSQPYYLQDSKTVKTGLQSVTLKRSDGVTVDGRHQKCGFPPNFVHSLDAAHMMMVAEKMRAAGGKNFAMVHDSFWCHGCDVDFMNEQIRECFITLHKMPLLDDLERDFLLMLGAKRGVLPPLPVRQEDLELDEVRKSLYFFD